MHGGKSGLRKPCRSASTMRYSATRWLTLSVVFSLIAYPGPVLASDAEQPDIGPPSVPAQSSSEDVIDTLGSAPADSTGSRESLVRELSTAAESGGLRAVLADPPDVGGTYLGGLSGLAALDRAGTAFLTVTDRGPNRDMKVRGTKASAF